MSGNVRVRLNASVRHKMSMLLFSALAAICVIGTIVGVLFFSRFEKHAALEQLSFDLLKGRILALNFAIAFAGAIGCFSCFMTLVLPAATFLFSFFNAYAMCCVCVLGQSGDCLAFSCAATVLCELLLCACAVCGADATLRSYENARGNSVRAVLGRCVLIAVLFASVVLYRYAHFA